jgi:hypothetical protein
MKSNPFVTRKTWPWLAFAVVASCLGWIAYPLLPFNTPDQAEGSWYLAAFAGAASIALTAPAAILYLTVVQQGARIGLVAYVGVILAISLPALAFQSIVVSASVMPVFVGSWVLSGSDAAVVAWLALSCALLYLVAAAVTYPFARRGGAPAALAATAVGCAIAVPVALRIFG